LEKRKKREKVEQKENKVRDIEKGKK